MIEKHADHLDHAAQVTEAATNEAVERYRRLAAPEQDPNNLNPNCTDCERPIEAGRLALNKKRCFQCQTEFERDQKLYRR
jgi:RNA polymerase-binding transcription factor DksA